MDVAWVPLCTEHYHCCWRRGNQELPHRFRGVELASHQTGEGWIVAESRGGVTSGLQVLRWVVQLRLLQ